MWTHFTALPHLFIQPWRSVILACFSQKSLQKLTSYEGQTQQHAYVGSRFSTLFSYKLCHRGHRAKSITLKQDCLQFDPSVFTGQRRSRISLLLLPLHSLSPSLSLSLFFLFFCRSWAKKKTTRTNNIQTHIRRVSRSLQRGSHVPLQFLLGVPVWKQTRVTVWRREPPEREEWPHGLSASIS